MKIERGKVHKDCPFSREEIDEFKAMLYAVNTGNHCMNAAPMSWVDGYQRYCSRRNMKVMT